MMDPSGVEAGNIPSGKAQEPGVRQVFSASGSAQQAVLGSGTQIVFFGQPGAEPKAPVSIAPPLGQRSDCLPLRGWEELLGELDGAGPRVEVLYGLGGCGKTRLALEVAFAARQDGIEVWWVSAAAHDVLEAGMHAVGRRLGLTDAELHYGDAADVVWQRLAARQEPWLLVIDNADDPQLLAERGDFAGAENAFREVLVTKLRVLGPDHPSTLVTAKSLEGLIHGKGGPADS